ncbi:hypothetical protein SAZ11_00560 [Streptomyces sp. FXJ1.4098]|nr:hypothetical protein [Streptomyces sp. FXJ1.4098]
MTISGYGEGTGPDAADEALEEGEQRTGAVHDEFLAALDTALTRLQTGVPQAPVVFRRTTSTSSGAPAVRTSNRPSRPPPRTRVGR